MEQTSEQPRRILLAEDDPPMCRMLAEVLTEAGHEITQARDGHELAMALAAHLAASDGSGYDAVISDVRLPGTTGVDALRSLREQDNETPFLFMTAFASSALREDAASLGAYVFDKPFDPYRLATFLGILLSAGEQGPSTRERRGRT